MTDKNINKNNRKKAGPDKFMVLEIKASGRNLHFPGKENPQDPDQLRPDTLETFKKYLNVRDSLSRMVVVPADMDLYALNYVIQRLFGFLNYHLHHFQLDPSTFRKFGLGSYRDWKELVGVLYQGEDSRPSDSSWDSRYDDSIIDDLTYFRRKYKYGVKSASVYETWPAASELAKRNPELKDRISVRRKEDGTKKKICLSWDTGMEVEPARLLERLPLDEILSLDPEKAALSNYEFGFEKWKSLMEPELARVRNNLDSMALSEKKTLAESTERLLNLREIYYDYMNEGFGKTGSETWLPIDKELKKEIGYSYNELESAVFDRRRWPIKLLSDDLNPHLVPMTDHLYYAYDYGCNWLFRISLKNELNVDPNGEITSVYDLPFSEDEADAVRQMAYKNREYPVVTELDGHFVHEDAGGFDSLASEIRQSQLEGKTLDQVDEEQIRQADESLAWLEMESLDPGGIDLL